MIDKEWLKSLKVGDEVCLIHSFGNKYRKSKIVRETTKLFILDNDYRIDKYKGTGGKNRLISIVPITDGVLKKIIEQNAKHFCQNLITKLSMEEQIIIYKFYKRGMK